MRRGGAAALAGMAFVLVALLSGAIAHAFIVDVEAHTAAVAATPVESFDGAEPNHARALAVGDELAHLFDIERGAAQEVWMLTRHSRAFSYSLLAKIALLVGIGLFWIASRVRGRAVRVLNGVQRRRIHAEDLISYAVGVGVAAVGVGVLSCILVALTFGSRFLSYYARSYSIVAAIVIGAALAVVTAVSLFALPSHHHLSERRPIVSGLLRVTRATRLIAFALLILAIGPAIRVATATNPPPLPRIGSGAVLSLSSEEIVIARYARYELWIATVAVGGLMIALLVSSLVGAYLAAITNARRDFTARINGAQWWRVGISESNRDLIAMVVIGVALIALVPSHLTFAHASAATLILTTAVAGGIAAHTAARRQVFARVSNRKT